RGSGDKAGFALHDPDLVLHWAVLKDDFEANRQFLSWRLGLGVSAASWRLNNRDESALLRGRVLAEALVFLSLRPKDLNAAEQEFINASQVAEATRQETQARDRGRLAEVTEAVQKRAEPIAQVETEAKQKAGAEAGTDAHRGPGQFFGISAEDWTEIPPAVRQQLYHWRLARLTGKAWFVIAIILVGLGLVAHFADGPPFTRLAMPTYYLIVALAAASVLWMIMRSRFFSRLVVRSESAESSEPKDMDGWWERLDGVIVMRATSVAPLIGSIPI